MPQEVYADTCLNAMCGCATMGLQYIGRMHTKSLKIIWLHTTLTLKTFRILSLKGGIGQHIVYMVNTKDARCGCFHGCSEAGRGAFAAA